MPESWLNHTMAEFSTATTYSIRMYTLFEYSQLQIALHAFIPYPHHIYG